MKLFKHHRPGFSLIEILAVLFVVSMSLIGVVSLIVQNIQAQSINKNNLIASSLAQEGVEMIRQVRDSNWRSNIAFDTNLADGSYKIDYRQDKPAVITNSAEAKIFFKNGFYVNQIPNNEPDLTPTIFTREVVLEKQIDYIGAPLQVRVIISWMDRNKPYRYELRALLFNWK